MTRFLRTVTLLSFATVAPAIVDAQTASSPVTVSIAAGAAMPMGDMGDVGKTGFTVGGGVEFGTSSLPFGLRAEVAYTRFGEKSASFTDPDLGTFSAAIRPSNLNINLNAVIAPKVPAAQIRPYAIGGVGFYNSTIDAEFTSDGTTISGDDSKGSFGLNGGAGVRFQFVGFSSFVEARYHYVFKGIPDVNSENEKWTSAGYLPIVFGISIGG
jgi:opacity protein-like surface antigen